MNIETTLYIRSDIFQKIIDAAEFMGISRNKLISMLLANALSWKSNNIKLMSSVKYQESSMEHSFNRRHVSFKSVMYEKCLDMRKLYKLSVSFILAIGVIMYLDKIIIDFKKGKIKKKQDNYHNNYLFLSAEHQRFFSFTIFWDFPPKKIIQKHLN